MMNYWICAIGATQITMQQAIKNFKFMPLIKANRETQSMNFQEKEITSYPQVPQNELESENFKHLFKSKQLLLT